MAEIKSTVFARRIRPLLRYNIVRRASNVTGIRRIIIHKSGLELKLGTCDQVYRDELSPSVTRAPIKHEQKLALFSLIDAVFPDYRPRSRSGCKIWIHLSALSPLVCNGLRLSNLALKNVYNNSITRYIDSVPRSLNTENGYNTALYNYICSQHQGRAELESDSESDSDEIECVPAAAAACGDNSDQTVLLRVAEALTLNPDMSDADIANIMADAESEQTSAKRRRASPPNTT